MNLVLDVINLFLTLCLKPMLVIGIVLYIVNQPDFRSAATNHWLMLLALFSPLILILFFNALPGLEFGVLPAGLATLTSTPVFLSENGLFENPNILSLTILVIYLVGMVSVLLDTCWSIANNQLVLNEAQSIADPKVEKIKRELLKLFSMQKEVEILVSKVVFAPVMCGLHAPKIILPPQYSEWQPARLRRVLAHELAHIERNDWMGKLLGNVICAIFWFNPFVWKARKQCDWFAELACDDMVVNKLQCRADYADDLLELSTEINHSKYAVLMFIKKSELYLRINAILDSGKNRDVPDKFIKATILAALVFLILPISLLEAKQSPYDALKANETANTIINVFDLGAVQPFSVSVPIGEENPIDAYDRREIKQKLAEFKKTLDVPKNYDIQQIAFSKFNDMHPHLDLRDELHTHSDWDVNDLEVVEHKTLKVVTPKYPKRALERNLEAIVVVEVDLDLRGEVMNPRIISDDHSRVFNKSVLKAIKKFKYQPMKINGYPIITKNVKETFIFTLKDAADTPKLN